jgi:PTH1 family peptidyl-tRNA hydrolase
MVELAAFLGNPGREYARNRHNAAWLLAKRLPFFPSLDWRKKYRGRYAALEGTKLLPYRGMEETGGLESKAPSLPPRIHFLMPETYMNNSGEAVLAAASFFKIPPERILVVHDELELPLGTVSLKFSGGLGGHNGLRSLRACFGTAGFWRLRIGIGRPDERLPGQGGREGSGRGILDWVLSNFSSEEEPVLEETLKTAAALFTELLLQGPEPLLPEWRKKKVLLPPRKPPVIPGNPSSAPSPH